MEILQSLTMDSNKSVIDIDVDDDDITIMEEIPFKRPKFSSSTPTQITSFDTNTPNSLVKNSPVQVAPKLQNIQRKPAFSLIEKVKLQSELKQAQSKISQHKELILDLQTKLKFQNVELQKLSKMTNEQKKLLINSRREKSKLKSVVTLERIRGEEKVNRLLDFLKHLNSEFKFAVNVLTCDNNNQSEAVLNNDEKSHTDKAVKLNDMDNELKSLSFEIVNKLEKVIDLHIERKDELDANKKTIEELHVRKKTIARTSTSTQTVSKISAYYDKNAIYEIHHQEPTKLRLKRAKYDYSQQTDDGDDDLSEIPQLEKYSSDESHILQNANTNINKERCDKSNASQSVNQINTQNCDAGKKHVMDTTKRGLSWIYCTCGLKFKFRSGLDSHIKLFRPVNYEDYIIDDEDELEEKNKEVYIKKQKPKLAQTWLIVDNRKTNERYTI